MRDTIRKSSNRYGHKSPQPRKFEPRVRFNWGFHEAQDEAACGKLPRIREIAAHFDRSYAAGYVRGYDAYQIDGKRSDSSEPAWQAHEADRAAGRAMRSLEPSNYTVRV
jgi:hypothetical protein